jgi:hypothetical protein
MMPGGTCGPIPANSVNVGSDGTIQTGISFACEDIEESSCTLRESQCTYSSGNGTVTSSLSLTFEPDGSTASGIATFAETMGGHYCASAYSVTAVRQ